MLGDLSTGATGVPTPRSGGVHGARSSVAPMNGPLRPLDAAEKGTPSPLVAQDHLARRLARPTVLVAANRMGTGLFYGTAFGLAGALMGSGNGGTVRAVLTSHSSGSELLPLRRGDAYDGIATSVFAATTAVYAMVGMTMGLWPSPAMSPTIQQIRKMKLAASLLLQGNVCAFLSTQVCLAMWRANASEQQVEEGSAVDVTRIYRAVATSLLGAVAVCYFAWRMSSLREARRVA